MNKFRSVINTDAEVQETFGQLLAADGVTLTRDQEAGIAEATHPFLGVIFKAIRKGKRGEPWICRYDASVFTFPDEQI